MITELDGPDRLPIVESPRMIGAVVCTEPCPDASVVNLHIQTLIIVVSSVNRANGFAGRVITLLAHYGDESSLHVGKFPLPVSFNSNPFEHSILVEGLVIIDWHIVLGLTSNYTGLTASAPVNVDHHSPVVLRWP